MICQNIKVTKEVWELLSQFVLCLHIFVLGMEELLHIQHEILEYLGFHFYGTVKYYDYVPFPSDSEYFGKCSGPTNNIESYL